MIVSAREAGLQRAVLIMVATPESGNYETIFQAGGKYTYPYEYSNAVMFLYSLC